MPASRAVLGLIEAGRSPPPVVTTVHNSRNRNKLTRPYRTLALTLIAPYVCRVLSKGLMANSWSSLAATAVRRNPTGLKRKETA